jgi:3-phenylpropionate/trans-cinnamate dioxygenase ferredoxin subunit
MEPITITVKPGGSNSVQGPAIIVDPEGNRWLIPEGSVVGLCRCGQSKRKPFCDTTHRDIGFSAPEPIDPTNVPEAVRPLD